MEFNTDYATIATVILVGLGLLWRVEARFSSLSDRVSRIEGLLTSFATKDDVARIEGNIARIEGRIETFATKADVARLEGYFMHASKKQDEE